MFLGGFGAQFAGGLASGVLRAWLASLGVPREQLEQSPAVIVRVDGWTSMRFTGEGGIAPGC